MSKYIQDKKTKIKLITSIAILAFFVFSNAAVASEISVGSVIKLVNKSRSEAGALELKENEKLDKVAQDKLDDMLKNDCFAHTSPSGVSPWHWYEKNGYDYQYAGENLAINFLTAEAQHKAWMASPTHKKNILNPNYQEIGVAMAAGEINKQTAIITVQEFGTRVGAAQAANDSKNFSGKEKTNLIKEGEENVIPPTVLSIKDITKDEFLKNVENKPEAAGRNYFKDLGEWMKNNRVKIAYYSDILMFILLAFAITLVPATFLALAFHDIRMISEIRNGPEEYLEKVSIEEYLEMVRRHTNDGNGKIGKAA